jgi:atlastin
VCGGDTPYMSTADLEVEHKRCRDEADKVFRSVRKMGGEQYSEQFLDKLYDDIQVREAIIDTSVHIGQTIAP